MHKEVEVDNMYKSLEEIFDWTKGTDYVGIMGDWSTVAGEGVKGMTSGKYGEKKTGEEENWQNSVIEEK